jgi:hypothetical protein
MSTRKSSFLSGEQQSKAWAKVEGLLRQDYIDPDIDAVKIICSCVAAHRIGEHPPVWVMCVAPSGSLKTAILQSLDGLPTVHFIDEVTPNTFVSGRIPERTEEEEKGRQKRKEKPKPASLLHRIGKDGFLVAADFSTILSMDERSRAKILAQLRRIYDGQFSREFGTEENLNEREWKGRLTFITGATPDIDSHLSGIPFPRGAIRPGALAKGWRRRGGAQGNAPTERCCERSAVRDP